MKATQQKSHIIYKRTAISLIFKDIFCFQRSSKSYSPILQIFEVPGSVSISQGNQGKNPIKNTYWQGDNHVKR